jgi:hypothetical protein
MNLETIVFDLVTSIAPLVALIAAPILVVRLLGSIEPGELRPMLPFQPLDPGSRAAVEEEEPLRWRLELLERRGAAPRPAHDAPHPVVVGGIAQRGRAAG